MAQDETSVVAQTLPAAQQQTPASAAMPGFDAAAQIRTVGRGKALEGYTEVISVEERIIGPAETSNSVRPTVSPSIRPANMMPSVIAEEPEAITVPVVSSPIATAIPVNKSSATDVNSITPADPLPVTSLDKLGDSTKFEPGSTSKPRPVVTLEPASQPLSPPAKPTAPAPPAKDVLKEAVYEIKESGLSSLDSLRVNYARLKNKQPVLLTLDQVVQALFFLFLGFQLLLLKWLRPNPGWLFIFTLLGIIGGIAYSAGFYWNKKTKKQANEVLGLNLGLKGLQQLLGGLPAWLNYTEREKVQWLNEVLAEVWPFYDAAVCKMIKDMTDTVFENALQTMPVPAIKRLSFKHLTFGDAPFRVESIYVTDKEKDALTMELDVRWSGEPNIALAIELAAGELTKICPKVTDISFVGSLRVVLKPLVNDIPCVGAMMITFRKPPRYKYSLDFGKALGGQAVAGLVKPFINWVIDSMVINSFVWPQRMVVPIINSEEMQIEQEKMSYRNQGLLKVTVLQCANLKKADILGSSDPFVELTTDQKNIAHTKTHKNTQNPRFDETFWLLVQEPASQELKVSVYDRDMFSAKELLTLNIGGTFGAKELLGKSLIKLHPITSQEPEPVTKWYHLGEGDFADAEGPGKGAGKIQLTTVYRSFDSFKSEEVKSAERGAVVVQVRKVCNLPRGGHGEHRKERAMTAYVRVRCGHHNAQTPPNTSKGDHNWKGNNTVMEFHNVSYGSDIKFRVFEKTMLQDDQIAEYLLPVSEVAESSDRSPLSSTNENGLLFRSLPLGENGATLYASVKFVPYY